MPDRYGFNELGDQVRCVDCPAGGPLGRWPEQRRVAHARIHRNTDLWRQRPLLAVSPTTNEEEKEAITLATSSKREPAKQVAIDILREAGQPLHAKEVAKRVLASGRCAGLKGKTPEATISAMLAVGSKPGGPFTRVDKGTYTLAAAGPPSNEQATSQTSLDHQSRTRSPHQPLGRTPPRYKPRRANRIRRPSQEPRLLAAKLGNRHQLPSP